MYHFQFNLGAKNDIQVQAMLGSISRKPVFGSAYYFDGQKSDWSETQTIEIPSIATSTPTSTDNSPIPSIYLLIISITLIVIAILLAVIIALLLSRRQRKTTKSEVGQV